MESDEKNIYLHDRFLLGLIFNKLQKDKIPKRIKLTEEQVCELLKYLKENDCINYVKTMGKGLSGFLNIKLTAKGTDVVLGRTTVREIPFPQTINTTHIKGNQNQVAQSGSDSSIIQIQDNSKINVLRQLIKNDKELDEPKKKKLFGILEKFNTLKESGESAYELIKQVGLIATPYIPFFLTLLN